MCRETKIKFIKHHLKTRLPFKVKNFLIDALILGSISIVFLAIFNSGF